VIQSSFDWRGYDPEKHDSIIINDCHDIATRIKDYRALFQSGPEDSTISDSRTMMYAQRVNTHRKPIVITLNKDGQWSLLIANEWVAHNAMLMDCGDEKMYTEPDVTTEDPKRARKRKYDDVCTSTWHASKYPCQDEHPDQVPPTPHNTPERRQQEDY
jgi:hypothetical protein